MTQILALSVEMNLNSTFPHYEIHSIHHGYGYVPQASQARVASMYEEELDLQHPLYAVHGYDEKQVRCAYATFLFF